MKNILLFLFCLTYSLVLAQTNNFIHNPYVEVTGKGEMEVIPNEFFLRITLDENESREKKNLMTLEKEMIDKIKNVGIDVDKNLTLVDLSNNSKSNWLKSEIFSVKKYQLKVDNAITVVKVFQVLESIGISNVHIKRISHSDITELEEQVRIKAIINAKAKANTLAQAINQSCGKAIQITERDYFIYGMRPHQTALSNYRKYSEELDSNINEENSNYSLEFENIKINISILVKFELN